jgi:hypothetical protein
MIDLEHDRRTLSRLVGCWQGTLLHRTTRDQPFTRMTGTAENRWVLGGRFVEMTLRAAGEGESWSAVFFIGYERDQRRHVLVSLDPGDLRVSTRLGEWKPEHCRLVMTGSKSRTVCDFAIPGALSLELAEEPAPGQEFVKFRADYRPALPAAILRPVARPHRRFVIA